MIGQNLGRCGGLAVLDFTNKAQRIHFSYYKDITNTDECKKNKEVCLGEIMTQARNLAGKRAIAPTKFS